MTMPKKKTMTKSRPARRPTTAAEVPAWLRDQGSLILGQVRTRLDKEGRNAYRQLETRVGQLQARLGRDTATLGRRVDDAVRGTLARLNIPSRREIAELTRKVDELSQKIDAFRTRSRRRGARA